jgi:hypothetical protein
VYLVCTHKKMGSECPRDRSLCLRARSIIPISQKKSNLLE